MRKISTVTLLAIGILSLYFPTQVFAGSIAGTVKPRGLRSPADILVYLPKASSAPADLSGAKFVMDQRNLTFIPHVLLVPVGAAVEFPNNDKVPHNVFSLSKTKPFNFGRYGPGENKSVVFDKPGVVELRCDIHADMSAYILVMKNPYFALTDDAGHFKIPDREYLKKYGVKGVKDLPPGNYMVKTWNEKLKTHKAKVDIPKDGNVSLQLDLSRGAPSALYK